MGGEKSTVRYKKSFGFKVYLVFAPVNDAPPGKPNCQVVCVKLNLASAMSAAGQHKGSWIERLNADKTFVDTTTGN